MLRVIAGELGGRRLRTPAGQLTRPTADRVRQALFNILGPPPEGALLLDLYAGSGALGIEGLSRGAARALFIEQNPGVCRTLAGNLRELGLEGRATVRSQPVRAALPHLTGPFHFIFADPPYASDEPGWLLSHLGESGQLAPGGTLIIERATRDADALASALPAGSPLVLTDRRRYGDTTLLFFGYAS